jgi:hypothetical protein
MDEHDVEMDVPADAKQLLETEELSDDENPRMTLDAEEDVPPLEILDKGKGKEGEHAHALGESLRSCSLAPNDLSPQTIWCAAAGSFVNA